MLETALESLRDAIQPVPAREQWPSRQSGRCLVWPPSRHIQSLGTEDYNHSQAG